MTSPDVNPLKRKRSSSPEEEIRDEDARPRWPGTKMLQKDNEIFKGIEDVFLSKMRRLDPDTLVTSIWKSDLQSGHDDFLTECEQMKSVRGFTNVESAWYGAPAEIIAQVMAHGFGEHNHWMLGMLTHGDGIYLSPNYSPYPSCLFSAPDDNGERHVILCDVILGNSEQILLGSMQSHPSSSQFDSGVDDLVKPRWYVVWDDFKKSHIHLGYVVSFTASFQTLDQPQGQRLSGTRLTDEPPRAALQPPQVSVAKVISALRRNLSLKRMQQLQTFYDLFKEGKISQVNFLGYIMSVLGEVFLCNILREIAGRE